MESPICGLEKRSDSDCEIEKGSNCNNENSDDEDLEVEDIGSELSEESYDYPPNL